MLYRLLTPVNVVELTDKQSPKGSVCAICKELSKTQQHNPVLPGATDGCAE
jgi:hypothetical protein